MVVLPLPFKLLEPRVICLPTRLSQVPPCHSRIQPTQQARLGIQFRILRVHEEIAGVSADVK